MEYSDINGIEYDTARELKQNLVKSNAFYEFNIGKFHKTRKRTSTKIEVLSDISKNGDSYEMLFRINVANEPKNISIGISGTLVSCWGFDNKETLKTAITELAKVKIMEMIKKDNIKSSYTFVSTDFPDDFQTGWEGYIKTRDSLI